MASGGVFQIISNDGKADRLTFAVELLENRINQIRDNNRKMAQERGLDPKTVDIEPTLSEIQESHLIHFQAKYKPIVPLAMEYQKMPPTSGGTNFGSNVSFSLAQFGDFYIDMVLNVNLTSCSAAAGAVPAVPADPASIVAQTDQVSAAFVTATGKTVQQVDEQAQVIRDFQYLGNYSHTGKIAAAGELMKDNVYYCDFPGERMFKTVAFTINGNPIDDYDKFSYVFYRNFKLCPSKQAGYYRCVGQELPVECVTQNIQDGVRHGGYVLNGPQTPKQVQPALSIWQKMLFWFNTNFSLAFPSAAVPFGQRYIQIELEDVQKLVFRAPALYTIVKVTNKYVPGTSFVYNATNKTYNLSGGIAQTVNTWYEYYQLPVYTNGQINYPTIQDMNLYCNNVFVHPWVHTIFMKRIGFYLVRLHKRQNQSVNQESMSILMNQFKFPVEYIYIGIIPSENESGQWQATDWHQFSKITHQESRGPVYLTAEANSAFDASRVQWAEKQKTINTLEVKAHGNILYQENDQQFYNSYKPLVFGEQTIVTPKDQGMLFVNFALFPGVFQPSGHINISRAREFYLNIKSKVIGVPQADTNVIQRGTLYSEATAMNFLLVSDGSAALRYGT